MSDQELNTNTGSFTGAAAIRKATEERNARIKKEQETKKSEQSSEEEPVSKGSIEGLIKQGVLPATVTCSLGELSYADFKAAFADVYSYVEDGEYLVAAKKGFSRKVGKNMVVELRTLTQEEEVFLDRKLYGDGQDASPELLGLVTQARLSLALTSLAGKRLPELPEVSTEDWWRNEDVKKRQSQIGRFDSVFVTTLQGFLTDIYSAKFFAIREAIANPE